MDCSRYGQSAQKYCAMAVWPQRGSVVTPACKSRYPLTMTSPFFLRYSDENSRETSKASLIRGEGRGEGHMRLSPPFFP